MSTSKFIINSLLKSLHHRKKNSGFTLIELLVAMILTFLIITPLMSLVISFMTNDRQEQAKNSSQQEIQAAVDYMAQDLQQAVYVYDAAALSRGNNNTDPAQSGIQNQIPPGGGAVANCDNAASCVPVLAFWKRKYLDRDDTVTDPVRGNQLTIGSINDPSQNSDRFVYSLVVYYLIKNDPSSSTWSQVNRIGRFELKGGILDPRSTTTNLIYSLNPDPGFQLFDLSKSKGKIKEGMNSWTKDGNYENAPGVVTLVDYIDNTLVSKIDANSTLRPPTNDSTDAAGNPVSTGCGDRTGQTLDTGGTIIRGSSVVPPDAIDTLKTGSFYACVNPVNDQGQSVVQIFLRGNAFPRLSKNPATWEIGTPNSQKQLASRPVANVRVAVRGLLNEPEE